MMSNENKSSIARWRAKYASTIVALACLYSCIESWGDNWFFTGVLALGVLICGTIGFFDLRRSVRK